MRYLKKYCYEIHRRIYERMKPQPLGKVTFEDDEWPSVDYLVRDDDSVCQLIKQDANQNIKLIHDFETRDYKL